MCDTQLKIKYAEHIKSVILYQCNIQEAIKLHSNTITGLLPQMWISSCGNYGFFFSMYASNT
jgi:hypothetical protein